MECEQTRLLCNSNTSAVSRGDSSWVGTASKTSGASPWACSAAKEPREARRRREAITVVGLGLVMVVASLICPHYCLTGLDLEHSRDSRGQQRRGEGGVSRLSCPAGQSEITKPQFYYSYSVSPPHTSYEGSRISNVCIFIPGSGQQWD